MATRLSELMGLMDNFSKSKKFEKLTEHEIYRRDLESWLNKDKDEILTCMISSYCEYYAVLESMRLMKVVDSRISNSTEKSIEERAIKALQDEVLRNRDALVSALISEHKSISKSDPVYDREKAEFDKKKIAPAYRILRLKNDTISILMESLNDYVGPEVDSDKFINSLLRGAERRYVSRESEVLSWNKN